MERDFFRSSAEPGDRNRLSRLLGVSRSSQYYRPKGEGAENLALMRRMDELHMAYPFYGSRQLMRHLRREGVAAGRHRIRRLMAVMGMEALPAAAHERAESGAPGAARADQRTSPMSPQGFFTWWP